MVFLPGLLGLIFAPVARMRYGSCAGFGTTLLCLGIGARVLFFVFCFGEPYDYSIPLTSVMMIIGGSLVLFGSLRPNCDSIEQWDAHYLNIDNFGQSPNINISSPNESTKLLTDNQQLEINEEFNRKARFDAM